MSAGAPRIARLGVAEPTDGAPPADRILAGEPRFRTWADYRSPDGTLHAGRWECTPGTWRIAYTKWEWMRITAGRCVVRAADGTAHDLGPGDTFVIEPGFEGTWEVVETMTKHYVIRV